MKLISEQIKLLGLSAKEVRVLNALRRGQSTPLLISRYTKVSRPAVYEILTRLKTRGIAVKNIRNGKNYWSQVKDVDLERSLYETKKAFFGISENVEEIHGLSDSTVIVYRGGEAIRKLLFGIIKDNKNKRLYAIQGDVVVIGWEKVFGTERTNEINRYIKKNSIIVEGIMPYGWFDRQSKLLGKKWARDFGGRMAVSHEVDEEYFKHGGQVWIFKNSVYLIAMNEELIIEVRNSEIQKLILSMFSFIQDNSQKFDVNERLQKILGKGDWNVE